MHYRVKISNSIIKRMKKLYFLFLMGFLLSGYLYGQENPRIDKKTFFSSPTGVEAAKNSFRIAEKYYKQGRGTFDEALKYYLKLYKYNSESNELNYKIAACYLWTSNKKASLDFFLKSSPTVSKDYYIGLGRAYQYNLMFDEAKDAYSKYLGSLKPWEVRDAKKLINQLIDECNVGKEIIQDSISAFIINLGPIVNTYYDEYGAILNPNESTLYFSSKRPENEPRKRVSRFKFKERVFVANNNGIDEPAAWAEGIGELDYFVNTSISGFDKEEEKIYIFKGEKRNGTILYSVKNKGAWKRAKPVKGGINHIAYKETTISIDSEGTAYFVTDRRGGYGGKDIWFATSAGKNKFNKPINLGEVINTPFDEEGVYVKPDGKTLFFPQKGVKEWVVMMCINQHEKVMVVGESL